ncbi:MAG: OmpA family protein [Pseudomonadota bacterium]
MPDGATLAHAEAETAGRYLVPTGPWAEGGIPAFEATGAVRTEVWRIADAVAGTGVMLAVFSGQLEEAGFAPLFTCTTRVCGGFDFRFALDIVPEPTMHVNLADFAFYAARRDTDAGPEYAALMVSLGGGAGFVHLVHVAPEPPEALAGVTLSSRGSDPDPSVDTTAPPANLAAALLEIGRAPLPGITFATGSTAISNPDAQILTDLAGFLRDNPDIVLTLVGHTDAEGALAPNIALSRARADAVRSVLIERYGIASARLSSEGVGFLMPLAPNTTQDGRDVNRRVEAVVINTR